MPPTGEILIQQVIDLVHDDGSRLIANIRREHAAIPLVKAQPYPQRALSQLTFPSGRPLSPGLRRWLAFDASWLTRLGWFDKHLHFTPRSLGQLAHDEYGEPYGALYAPLSALFPECFLLPGGSDSRRVYAITTPNTLDEYPVLALDIDEQPYVGIMYPGFDSYMGFLCGIFSTPSRPYQTYEDLFENPDFASQLQEHAARLFNGEPGIEAGLSDLWPWALKSPDESNP